MTAPFLFVIARTAVERHEFVRRHFANEPEVEIVFDRRVGERRTRRLLSLSERRRSDRRQNDVSSDVASLGWAYVRRSEVTPASPPTVWSNRWARGTPVA